MYRRDEMKWKFECSGCLAAAVASPEFWLRRGAAVVLWYCSLQAFWGSRCPFSISKKIDLFIFSYL